MKELMMFFKKYGINGIFPFCGGIGGGHKKRKKESGGAVSFEGACFPSSFCFDYSFLGALFFDLVEEYLFFALLFGGYCRKEMSTPAATAEPMTPEMLLAMQ